MTGTVLRAVYGTVTQGIKMASVETRETVAVDPARSVIRVRREHDDAIYGRDAYWPKQQLRVTEAWMGTRKLARVVVAPVQYNPVEQTVRICRELDAELHFNRSPKPESGRGPL